MHNLLDAAPLIGAIINLAAAVLNVTRARLRRQSDAPSASNRPPGSCD
ncbi:hypothetical protein ACQP2T_61065 [Nonomuraea sp. CA-143628]